MREWLKKYGLFTLAVLTVILVGISTTLHNNTPNPMLKEYKDGIQNHLTWSIKGECFFVRPNDDVTVYLVRVPDCDRK